MSGQTMGAAVSNKALTFTYRFPSGAISLLAGCILCNGAVCVGCNQHPHFLCNILFLNSLGSQLHSHVAPFVTMGKYLEV